MSNNSFLMSYSRMPSQPYESRQAASPQHQIRNSWKFMDDKFSRRQPRTKCSQTFPHVQQPNTSKGLQVSLATLDHLHTRIRRPQTNDRAYVSMSVHIKHLGSEVCRILGSRNFAQCDLWTAGSEEGESHARKKRSHAGIRALVWSFWEENICPFPVSPSYASLSAGFPWQSEPRLPSNGFWLAPRFAHVHLL